jgi:hypothetical protein
MSNRYLSYHISVVVFLALVVLPIQHLAAATLPHSPYQATVELQRVYEAADSSRSTREEMETLPTVTIKGRLRNVGFIDARFTIRRNKIWGSSIHKHGKVISDTTTATLLQGRLAVGGSWRRTGSRMFPTALSIIGKTLRFTFPGRATGSKGSRQRLYTITVRLDGSVLVRARVASVPRSIGRRGACGAAVGLGSLAHHAHSASEEAGATSSEDGSIRPLLASDQLNPALETSRVLTISTDADEQWYQRYGDQSNAVIAGIINTAEAIFSSQLGVRFRLVQQHVYAEGSPYTSTDPSKLLSSFAMNPNNRDNLGQGKASFHQDVDLKHLFTGKDLDGSTIGIAYIGATCAVPAMSYGVTQSFMDVANPAIFAHELGHNLGANHDLSSQQGLMYPAISFPAAQEFSPISLEQISAHLTRYGTCISLEQLAPLPQLPPSINSQDPEILATTPASLTLSHKRIRFENRSAVQLSGTLLSRTEAPLKAAAIVLMVQGQEVGRAVTNAKGRFRFLVRLHIPSGKTISLFAQTEGVQVASNELIFSNNG